MVVGDLGLEEGVERPNRVYCGEDCARFGDYGGFEILESVEDEGGASGHGSYCVGDEELESWGLKVSDSANAGDVSAPEETFQTWNGSDWKIHGLTYNSNPKQMG